MAAHAWAAASGGTWGKAGEVPGTAALNKGGNAALTSVSCVSAGNCSAGGSYNDGSGSTQVFVVSETGGTWGKAEEVPGIAVLNKGGVASIPINSVSCASAGNCSAGGSYVSGFTPHGVPIFQAFIVSQVNGTWGAAKEVPGTAVLNKGGDAAIGSVSCASAGNCSAGGYYAFGSAHGGPVTQAFVVSERGGVWGKAREVAGALNTGGGASVDTVSCASAGNCSVGGQYVSGVSSFQAFVVNEINGTWGTAEEVPGTGALNKGGFALLSQVSCASARNCSAVGYYSDAALHSQGFVVGETGGVWGTAKEVAAALNKGGDAAINSLSCASPGNCGAGGNYAPSTGASEAFVVTETNGTWGTAKETAGALNTGNAALTSVSCGAAGNCSAGGYYDNQAGLAVGEAFVVSEVNGVWGTAEEVPGTAALNQGGDAFFGAVSCASAADCSGAGWYTTRNGAVEAFVVNEA